MRKVSKKVFTVSLSLLMVIGGFGATNVFAGEWMDAVNGYEESEFDASEVLIETNKNRADGYFITQDGAMWGFGAEDIADTRWKHYYPERPRPPRGTVHPIYGNMKDMDDEIVLTKDGEVYVWAYIAGGDNYLRGEYDPDAYHPYWPMTKVPGLPENLVQVEHPGFAYIALAADGKVYGWGKNQAGVLLKGEDKDIYKKPIELNFPEPIDKIVVEGESRCFAISDSGSVYAWGGSDHLSYPDHDFYSSPYKVTFDGESDVKIVDVAAHHRRAYFVSDDGKVYVTGRHGHMLGLTKNDKILNLQKGTPIPNLNNVVDVAAGDHGAFALTEDGTIYSWGINEWGHLGRGIEDQDYKDGTPTPIEGIPAMESVDAHDLGILALDKEGNLWGWGRSTHTLVNGERYEGPFYSPHKIFDVKTVRQLYAEEFALQDGFDMEEVREHWGQNGVDQFMKYFKWEWINPGTNTQAIMTEFHEWMGGSTLDGGVIVNGRTLLPLRSIFEAVGAKVTWDNATKKVGATRGNITIGLQIDSTVATFNGASITLDTPPQIINSKTMVPVRFIAESVGADISWDQENRIVTIKLDGQELIIKIE
ncbi:hypothetical protein E3U55_14180 [Filobacillus milosensis]|uniref:Copper amine oxidase-like N-terminal domain-containing protein n=1 Tax=Filobacillus milosensis TaxID=94137 RepID=A0A4Y8IHM6_9BACI|nr:stalk domain-containing protein [Filobacillus milosensis]TFB14193.1 hypothetical protein E3U55_14180 [Filobacillus milosensis]